MSLEVVQTLIYPLNHGDEGSACDERLSWRIEGPDGGLERREVREAMGEVVRRLEQAVLMTRARQSVAI